MPGPRPAPAGAVIRPDRALCPALTNLDAGNLNVEHGPAEDVASVVAVKLDALELDRLVKVDRLDLAKAALQVILVKQGVVDRQVAVHEHTTLAGWLWSDRSERAPRLNSVVPAVYLTRT